ncbi:hypothetical protein F2Q69_00042502 [Brassica cretica]|uniref:NmrA-like domain-containing protein n=1 Tax=Brassica cretica TaxID=69181 RepID=A0A8S9NI26_BRACR|nr:hypothetical protein F2Q69_00042502 [Brassica cretica]
MQILMSLLSLSVYLSSSSGVEVVLAAGVFPYVLHLLTSFDAKAESHKTLEAVSAAGGETIEMVLVDAKVRPTQLKCVAYGIQNEKVNEFWCSTTANTVICVLSFWRIEWGEGGFKYITNTGGSQICFDDDIPEIQDFKSRFPRPHFKVLWVYPFTMA